MKSIFIEMHFHPKKERIFSLIEKRGGLRRLALKLKFIINNQTAQHLLDTFNLSYSNCRFCKKTIKKEDAAITIGYWIGTWYICHKNCKQKGESDEAFDCQKIDQDCNDCYFFKRIKKTKGWCEKYNKSMIAAPKFASGYDCFEHRKAKGESE